MVFEQSLHGRPPAGGMTLSVLPKPGRSKLITRPYSLKSPTTLFCPGQHDGRREGGGVMRTGTQEGGWGWTGGQEKAETLILVYYNQMLLSELQDRTMARNATSGMLLGFRERNRKKT